MSAIIFGIMIKFGKDISCTTFLYLNLLMDCIVISMITFAYKPTIAGIKALKNDMIKKINKQEIAFAVAIKGLTTLGGGKLLIDFLH